MRLRDLWRLCEECVETYDLLPRHACCTIDEHVDELLSSQVDIGADEVLFVREAVAGVFHHRRLLELTLDAFCDAMHRNRQDYVSMLLIAYLLIFRFGEIGGEPFRDLIYKSTANTRIVEFLQFLLSEEKREEFAVPRWRRCYDDAFVEEQIVGALRRHQGAVEARVLSWYLAKATSLPVCSSSSSSAATGGGGGVGGGGGEGENAAAGGSDRPQKLTLRPRLTKPTATVARSPQFTRPRSSGERESSRPRLPPAEVREMIHTKPLPKLPRVADRCTAEEREAVAAARRGEKRSTLSPSARARNRRREKEIPFVEFAEHERPSDKERLLCEKAEREAREVAQLELRRPSPRQVREQLHAIATTVDVRTTAAALRREDVVYRKRQQEEEADLRRREQALRDDSEYWAWRNKEEQREKAEREARLAQRKLDMMIADEEARAVRGKQQKANQAISRDLRMENKKWRARFEREERRRVEEQRRRALELKEELRADAEEAVARVVNEKRQVAAQVKTEKQEGEMRVAMALELERERKQEIIAQIKELHARSAEIRERERQRKRHVRAVDIGQLVTMTYDELQEKLVEVRAEQAQLVEARRAEILNTKEQRRREEAAMIERIGQQRQRFRNEKEEARERRRREEAEEAEKARVTEERKIFELQAKLREKREARQEELRARREEERQRRLQAQLLSADAGAIEAEKWCEMERGAENVVVRAQNSRINETRRQRSLQRGVERLRESNIAAEYNAHLSARMRADELLATKKTIFVAEKEQDDALRRAANAAIVAERGKLGFRSARSA